MTGERIKQLRQSKNYSQAQLAGLLSVSEQQVYRWEKGQNEPAGEHLVRLAQEFGITTDYLLGASDDPLPRLTNEDLSVMERKLVTAARNGQIVEALETLTAMSKQAG